MASNYQLKLKGWVGGYDFDEDYVDYVIDKYAGKHVDVLIDSLGGSLKSALSIAASFGAHGDVTVHFVGMNASAATIASLGAKHITIDAGAMYLVHKCAFDILLWESCNADSLETILKRLEQDRNDLNKFDLNVASMYAAKCHKDKQELLDLMAVGGWLTAQEALDWGFVDEITSFKEDDKPDLSAAVVAAMDKAGIPMKGLNVQESFIDKLINLIKPKNNSMATQQEPAASAQSTTPQPQANEPQAQEPQAPNASPTDEPNSPGPAQQPEPQAEPQPQANADSSDKVIADLNEQIKSLKAQIEELKKQTPGAQTTSVVENGGKKSPENDFASTVKNAHEIFNQIP
jgi:ATP-dependent protease ClpP protease subunit